MCSETQGITMKFGLFQSVQLPEPGAQAQYYKAALEQVLRAEQLGFDSVWFTEHHFSRHGIVPASLTVLAYLAGMTTTIKTTVMRIGKFLTRNAAMVASSRTKQRLL